MLVISSNLFDCTLKEISRSISIALPWIGRFYGSAWGRPESLGGAQIRARVSDRSTSVVHNRPLDFLDELYLYCTTTLNLNRLYVLDP